MEFVKGEKVKFNLKTQECDELAGELSLTYGNDYLVHSVGRLVVVITDDNNDKVAWTIETANSMFVPLDYTEPAVQLKRCEECEEVFKWDDELVWNGEIFYHKECVHVFPIAYGLQIIGGDYIGESEANDGEKAFNVLEEGEYEEDEEEEV